MKEEEIIQIMKDHFYLRYFVPGLWAMSKLDPDKCRHLLEQLYKTQGVLKLNVSQKDTHIVEKLIESNLLRYDIKGTIQWHSKLTEHFYKSYRKEQFGLE